MLPKHIRLLIHIYLFLHFYTFSLLASKAQILASTNWSLTCTKDKSAIEIEIKYQTNCKHVKLSINVAPNLK